MAETYTEWLRRYAAMTGKRVTLGLITLMHSNYLAQQETA